MKTFITKGKRAVKAESFHLALFAKIPLLKKNVKQRGLKNSPDLCTYISIIFLC